MVNAGMIPRIPFLSSRGFLALVAVFVILPLSFGFLYLEGNSPADVTPLTIDGAPRGIVFIADPHLRESNLNQTREIIRQINALQPSVVLIGGDFTYGNNATAELALQNVWSGVDAPVYAVLGNHDYQAGLGAEEILRKMQEVHSASLRSGDYDTTGLRDNATDYGYANQLAGVLGKNGIRVLRNEYGELTIDGRKVIIVGVDDCWAGMAEPPQVPRDEDAFVIYLVHEPECRADWDADLILAGHTHGGQFIPSGLERIVSGGLFTLSGEIRDGQAVTYITRGTGTSNLDISLRSSPPEIVVVNPRSGAG